jgi:transcriptional regulator with XRE-family HTH domain
MTNLGERLRQLRHDKGLVQADIEKRTGILRCYVSRVELGFISPHLTMLRKWAKALRVPLYEVFLPDEAAPQHGPLPRLSGEDKSLRELLGRIPERGRRMLLAVARQMAMQGGLKTANEGKRQGAVLLTPRNAMMDVGKRLRELRVAEGLSQYQLARRGGFQQPYICNVERGRKVPQLAALKKWTKALGVPLTEFFKADNASRKAGKDVRIAFWEKRLFDALRRMSEADRRLFFSVAETIAEGKQA